MRPSVHVDLGGVAQLSIGFWLWCGCEGAVFDPIQRVDEEPSTAQREPLQQLTRCVIWSDRLRHHGEDGPSVELEHNSEGRRARYLITSQDRALDWRRATPSRQQREVQVDPAVPRDVQDPLREQCAVCDHRAAVRRNLSQATDKLLIPGTLRPQDLNAKFGGVLRDWAGGQLLAAATWGIRPRYNGDQVVAGIGQRIQRRDRDIRSAAKDDSHRRSLGRPT